MLVKGQGSVWETNKLSEYDGVIMVAKLCLEESTIQFMPTCTDRKHVQTSLGIGLEGGHVESRCVTKVLHPIPYMARCQTVLMSPGGSDSQQFHCIHCCVSMCAFL